MSASVTLCCRLPAPLGARLRAFASAKGIPVSAAARLALARGLREFERDDAPAPGTR